MTSEEQFDDALDCAVKKLMDRNNKSHSPLPAPYDLPTECEKKNTKVKRCCHGV
jgi:hypothetical protein